MALKLTFACGSYDRMEPLKDGAVAPAGIDLQFTAIESPREIFDRMSGAQEFDASELSASEFIARTGAGRCPFVAIPVFPSRSFRHGFVCVNRDAGIRAPKDLEGRRIGVPLYTQTAAIWVRGHLAEEYGVDFGAVEWVEGAVEKAGDHGAPTAMPLLEPARIARNESGRSLSDMLAEGEIDALLGSRLPASLFETDRVARLFPDYRAVERDFYLRTRIHPIMHLVAIRKELHEAEPWVAGALYEAMERSKAQALARLRVSAAQKVMLPFLFADLDEIDEVFGGDPWPYGAAVNRPTLEALMRHMVDQHFIAEPIPVESLFVPVGPAGS